MSTVSEEKPPVVLEFDSAVFSLETIKRALYRFADWCSFDFQAGSDGKISIIIRPRAGSVEDLVHRIRNEVLDQDLRARIAEETSNIRTLILANAFSKTGLIEG